MSYRISIEPAALEDLSRMPANLRNRARQLIRELAADPIPPRSKQLRDPLSHLRRIPLEKWRIIYLVDEEEQEVLIVRVKRKIGPETYEDLM